jgi:hypothetical protein
MTAMHNDGVSWLQKAFELVTPSGLSFSLIKSKGSRSALGKNF